MIQWSLFEEQLMQRQAKFRPEPPYAISVNKDLTNTSSIRCSSTVK